MDKLCKRLALGEELNKTEVGGAVEMLLSDSVSEAAKAEFLTLLTNKGETATEILHFVEACLTRAVDPKVDTMSLDGPTLDVVGTGGSKLDLFNISTTSMFVMAAGGATVVKHGNRGFTSKSGGADVLEELGVNLEISVDKFQKCLEHAGVGFMFAPHYHPSFKAIGPVRRKLAENGTRTIFNLIGPLLNPAKPDCQMIGICNPAYLDTYAEILKSLGRKSAWIVRGKTADTTKSVDELSLMGESEIRSLSSDGSITSSVISPADLGLTQCSVEDLRGGDAVLNAKILQDILSGKEQGARREMVILNAAGGLASAGLIGSLQDGVKQAAELIDSGAALDKLRRLQEVAV